MEKKFLKQILSPSLIILVMMSLSGLSFAGEDEGEEDAEDATPRTAIYIKLSQGMVVNYGEPSLSRLKYMKIALQVRLGSVLDAEAIEHHMPALKDALITFFSSCDETLLQSKGGREEIRKMALGEVQEIMIKEEGQLIIEDLLFGSFIVQR